MNIDESILSKLTDEQKKKIEAAQSPEELLALAKQEGYELSKEQLEAVSGGQSWYCPTECSSIQCFKYNPCPKLII